MQQISCSELFKQCSLEQLNNGSIFGAISEDCIWFLLSECSLYKVRAGNRVFDYGEKGDSFFVVCKGCLSFISRHEGESFHTRNIQFGEESGFVSMIALQDRSGYTVAREDSIVLQIPSSLFSELHMEYPFDFGIITLNLARDMARNILKLRSTLMKNAIRYW